MEQASGKHARPLGKPERDVKDFAMDFDLTENTLNQAFAMSPKLKSKE